MRAGIVNIQHFGAGLKSLNRKRPFVYTKMIGTVNKHITFIISIILILIAESGLRNVYIFTLLQYSSAKLSISAYILPTLFFLLRDCRVFHNNPAYNFASIIAGWISNKFQRKMKSHLLYVVQPLCVWRFRFPSRSQASRWCRYGRSRSAGRLMSPLGSSPGNPPAGPASFLQQQQQRECLVKYNNANAKLRGIETEAINHEKKRHSIMSVRR